METTNGNDIAIMARLKLAESLLRRYRAECYDNNLDTLTDVYFFTSKLLKKETE